MEQIQVNALKLDAYFSYLLPQTAHPGHPLPSGFGASYRLTHQSTPPGGITSIVSDALYQQAFLSLPEVFALP
jgi:hypothetical protein